MQSRVCKVLLKNEKYSPSCFTESIIQGSVIIIVVATGKLQDASPTDSLEGAVTVWLVYAFVSVLVSGALLGACCTSLGQRYLPAVRLSQVRPRHIGREVERLWELRQDTVTEEGKRDAGMTPRQKEEALKSPVSSSVSLYARRVALGAGFSVVLIAWVIFGFGVDWGDHASSAGE